LYHKRSSRGDYYRVAAVLLYHALKFRYCKLRSRPLKPTVVSLAVTNRCNSHCIMCNIWKRARDFPEIKNLELSSHQIINIFAGCLFKELVELDLTGGEPHLRDDLADIVLEVIKLKKSSLPKLRSIVITSNGFLTRRIITNYRVILQALKDTNIDLVSVISLDGIGDVHDQIRGTGGAFKLALETLGELSELKKEYPHLIPGIKTTILPQNFAVLHDILDFALANNLFYIISPVLFTEARFINMDRRDEITPAPAEYKQVQDFYTRHELKTSYYYTKELGYLKTGRKKWSCAALFNYLFIDFDGKVYPCEIISGPIGNVKEQDIKDIWNSPRAQNWRTKIGKLECCQTCHEPGAVRYSAFSEGLTYLQFLLSLGRHKFTESWHGEGFSKYYHSEINR
jgi:MoaA/NifB/PqqE/SkfB family radical SAM enzyme